MSVPPLESSTAAGWNLDHSYSRLPALFFSKASPAPVRNSGLVIFNDALALSLGLDPESLRRPDQAALFTGNLLPPGANPIAQAYAGHQFGHFNALGDGRAILLGEQITPDGQRFDIQLKGSGPTRFSRNGDGLAALGPMLREYLISEAMHALGIPTTRSLAVATTGESVFRKEELPGAVLTRVAASHIRVGTFQWAAAHEDLAALQALADHTRRRHFPGLEDASHFEFYRAVMERQASLMAKWLQVGFVHGVMNTDNMALCGETIDYGPCAFIDRYDPAAVFSSIDHQGRYAYSQQPPIARWNLARLAEAMLPLLHEDEKKAIDLANEALHQFEGLFQNHWLDGMRAKLGLAAAEPGDQALVQQLLDWMQANRQDFTNSFRALSTAGALEMPPFDDPAFLSWHEAWLARLGRENSDPAEILSRLQSHNPRVIPRNHHVEAALQAATDQGDLSPFHKLLEAVSRPFEKPADAGFESPPPADAPRYRTFCGT